MASFQKTFRKSGNHHAEFHSLQGVEIKIGEKFRPPKKVTLPVGWQQKDPSGAISLTYDFSLEEDVISKSEALKASRQEQPEIACTESQTTSPSVDTTDTAANHNLVFSNVGSEILQPVVAPGLGHKKKDSFGGKGKNAFDISDFEGDTSTPFELVELQTINDLDELKNVLQPNALPATTSENSAPGTNAPLANMSGSSINLPTITVPSSENSLVDISGLHITGEPSTPLSSRGIPSTNTGTEASSLLVDIGDSQSTTVTPAATYLSTSSTFQNNSLSSTNRPFSRGGLLPPIGQSFPSPVPQEQQEHQTSSMPIYSSTTSSSLLGGINSFPSSVAPSQGKHLGMNSWNGNTQYRQCGSPNTIDQQWNMLRSPEDQNPGGRFPSPLPPIGKPYNETLSRQSSYQSSLPDPWPILTDKEKSFARNIVSMGFPAPRVARAVQRLGTNDKEVFEFLITVNELCEQNYPADSVEVALVFNSEKAKAVEFLELVKTFKEYGFKEENIHECLKAADNDSEKALEYLMTLST